MSSIDNVPQAEDSGADYRRAVVHFSVLCICITEQMWTVWISSKEPGAAVLAEQLRVRHVNAEVKNIEVSDICFVHGGKTYIQAEIKGAKDFLSSIKDCRYYEQSASIAESQVPFNFYLVKDFRSPPGIDLQEDTVLQHAVTRLQLSGAMNVTNPSRCHIAVVYITTVNGIMEWVHYVSQHVVTTPLNGVFAPLSENVRHNYGSKPRHRRQHDVWVEMLARVSGISVVKARRIASYHPSMASMVKLLESVDSEASLIEKTKHLKVGRNAVLALYHQIVEHPYSSEDCDQR